MLIDDDEEELLELDADTVLCTDFRAFGDVGGGHLGTGEVTVLGPKWETLVEVVIGVEGRGAGAEVEENGRVRARA